MESHECGELVANSRAGIGHCSAGQTASGRGGLMALAASRIMDSAGDAVCCFARPVAALGLLLSARCIAFWDQLPR